MRELTIDAQTYESICVQQFSLQKNVDDQSENKLEGMLLLLCRAL